MQLSAIPQTAKIKFVEIARALAARIENKRREYLLLFKPYSYCIRRLLRSACRS